MKTPKAFREMEFRGLINELIALFHPHTYVEIGVKNGWTFNEIAPQVRRAVAVDPAPMKEIHDWPQVEKFRMTSAEFVKIWTDPIDLLFIDGDHRKDAVLHDIYQVGDFVREGTGLILCHDTHPVREELLDDGHCSTAWKAVWEIRLNFPEYEVVTLPGPWAGLSILRRAPRHLYFQEVSA